jgi:hypothetical protein
VPQASDGSSTVEQERNEQAWRQLLVQGVLAVLLPTEDVQNGCLRALVGEILAEMIVGKVLSNRLCEGWALWEIITHAIEAFQDRGSETGKGTERGSHKEGNASVRSTTANQLEQFGLLHRPLPAKAAAAAAVVERQARAGSATGRRAGTAALASTFWLVVKSGIVLVTAVRAVVWALMTMSSGNLPCRGTPTTTTKPWAAMEAGGRQQPGRPATPRPIVSMALWSTVANIVELSARMPWLAGLLSLAQLSMVAGPGRVGDTDGLLDR